MTTEEVLANLAESDAPREPYAVVTTAERTVRNGRDGYRIPAGHVVRIVRLSPNKVAEHSQHDNLRADEKVIPLGALKIGDQAP